MVLFKRKPFALIPPPENISDNAEVFVMRGTGEVFTDYEKYLKRYDFLIQASDFQQRYCCLIANPKQKKFVDAVNGKSGLNYFDALESESKSTSAIETVFPEVLRDPILRRVQFSTISRIDDLVNCVYDDFKHNFFPKEEVMVMVEDFPEHRLGVIREKAKFPQILSQSGEVQREAFCRYFVRLYSAPREEYVCDDLAIRRDRKVYNKQNVRAFLKHTLFREPWIGAPWLVREHFAIKYRLPMDIPVHLLQESRLLANKVQTYPSFLSYLHQFFPDLANAYAQQQILQNDKPSRKRTKNFEQDEFNRMRHAEIQHQQMQEAANGQPGTHPGNMHVNPPLNSSRTVPRPAAPPPIKYPIEDLEIPPKRNGVVRPQLQFFTDEMENYIKRGRLTTFEDIEMESMGMLLEVWNTLNVQCEVYALDSFTFDDFIDAMRFRSDETKCVLLDEVFCATLKVLVDDKGVVNLSKGAMPEMIAESEDEDSEDPQDESELSTPLPDAPARSTRSRLSHVDPSKSPTALVEKLHRGSEMLGDRKWSTRIGARDFQDGGWQVALAGVLLQLSRSARFQARCNDILAWLAPTDQPPTPETARDQFAVMDINLRISALQMITILSIATPTMKNFLEQCSDDMTDVRKRKIEYQREKKEATAELMIKDRERKILLPANMPDSPPAEALTPVSANDGTPEVIDVSMADSSDPEDEAPTSGRALRRGNDRKRKRDEEAQRAAEEKRKAELAKQHPKQSKEFRKLLGEIEVLKTKIMDCEEAIAECDGDLREANVQRTKVLGKDRFCNRYYWFERNGQPFGGLPNSSTAAYGYANGRIWVQGPDEMEREGFVDRTPEEQKVYQRVYGCTVPERRKLEEGETVLLSANEWGYYDNPVLLDNLIGWLDDRGDREKALRRELVLWRDTIGEYMDKQKKFKDLEAAKKLGADEEQTSRISTRTKTHEGLSQAKERCLRWTNGLAIEQFGHLHSEPAKSKAKIKLKQQQLPRQKGVATVPLNRYGKPVTRQG
ncbi:uncharacterized protein LTR77_001703 [Saxophila tyrrhenica]|uniref:Imitation switch two complex protein 1 n=1 Tax=Saxophila tyrrhenica TaxID=1690608 RepID=A0AAV9PQN1_9PEZI|nr:hypothetical protein LTR77_001703 [Saxophila tyrrhenica]